MRQEWAGTRVYVGLTAARGRRVCGHPWSACVQRQAKATQAWHVPVVPGMMFALWEEFQADNHTVNKLLAVCFCIMPGLL